jgi:heme-degrading monooxygenase HmoA
MVRVLIERRVADGMLGDFYQALHRMRLEALPKRGYISGESWRDARDPHHLVVISSWVSRGDWETWSSSEERRSVMATIGPMLHEPEKVTILEPL